MRVQGCTFNGNGLDGMLIDQEHELVPGWTADILVRDSWARANRGAGFHVDADATSTVLLHGLLATANVGDGILVTAQNVEYQRYEIVGTLVIHPVTCP